MSRYGVSDQVLMVAEFPAGMEVEPPAGVWTTKGLEPVFVTVAVLPPAIVMVLPAALIEIGRAHV